VRASRENRSVAFVVVTVVMIARFAAGCEENTPGAASELPGDRGGEATAPVRADAGRDASASEAGADAANEASAPVPGPDAGTKDGG
jgi:hypothetical protein